MSEATNALSIGGEISTPIGEPEPVAWMSPGKERLEFSRPDTVYGSHTIPLIRQSDAEAIIAGLHAEVKRLMKERDHWKANHDNRVEAARVLIDRPDIPFERTNAYLRFLESQATITQQAERIAELEASLEIEKGQCELREEENRILFARMEAQAAALAKARDALALVNKYAPRALECAHFHHPKRMQHGDGDFCEPTHMYYHALNISVEALATIDALKQPEGEKWGA